jgi:putative transposon-encoded protein
MVRRMKAIIKQIESVVTPSGNSGHVVVPKDWIGKEVIVKIKQQKQQKKYRYKRSLAVFSSISHSAQRMSPFHPFQ